MGVGKWIGGTTGFVAGGPFGALAGYTLGSLADLGNNPAGDTTAYGSEHAKENVFAGRWNSFLFSMLIMVLCIIRANGCTIHNEMEYIRNFLRTNFGVTAVGEGGRVLLNPFEQYKRMDMQNPFTSGSTIRGYGTQIAASLTYKGRLQLLRFLANITQSDNNVCREEIEALKEVAAYMGSSEKEMEPILNSGGDSLDVAYKVSETNPIATDEEVRATYRRLVLKHHPNRVTTLGGDIKHAIEEKLQSTNNTKEIIYKARGMK